MNSTRNRFQHQTSPKGRRGSLLGGAGRLAHRRHGPGDPRRRQVGYYHGEITRKRRGFMWLYGALPAKAVVLNVVILAMVLYVVIWGFTRKSRGFTMWFYRVLPAKAVVSRGYMGFYPQNHGFICGYIGFYPQKPWFYMWLYGVLPAKAVVLCGSMSFTRKIRCFMWLYGFLPAKAVVLYVVIWGFTRQSHGFICGYGVLPATAMVLNAVIWDFARKSCSFIWLYGVFPQKRFYMWLYGVLPAKAVDLFG